MAATTMWVGIQHIVMVGTQAATMTDRRALLTDREREIVANEADVSDSYRYQTISRIRSRLERLDGDLDALGKHGDLLDELREVVCSDIAQSDAKTASVRRSSTSDPKGENPEDHPPEQPPVTERDRARLEDELAGSGDLLERRVDAMVAMYDVLREKGEAEKDDLLEAVDVDATGYQDETSVWSNMVKGCDTLRALPGVKTPGPGRTVWRYNEGDQE